MRRRRGVCIAVAWSLVLLPASGWAKRNDPLTIARNHLKHAKSYFQLGEFEKAAREWTFAFKYKEEPALLFNIAQAYRLAGNVVKAKTLYERYLTVLPSAPNRSEVEAFIGELTQTIARSPAPAAPAAIATTEKKKRSHKKKATAGDP